MVTCPHCEEPLELTTDSGEVPIHHDGTTTSIEPELISCYSCDALLFATVSRELQQIGDSDL